MKHTGEDDRESESEIRQELIDKRLRHPSNEIRNCNNVIVN